MHQSHYATNETRESLAVLHTPFLVRLPDTGAPGTGCAIVCAQPPIVRLARSIFYRFLSTDADGCVHLFLLFYSSANLMLNSSHLAAVNPKCELTLPLITLQYKISTLQYKILRTISLMFLTH